MQKVRRLTGSFVLLPIFAFFLAACGGGGGDSAPDLSPAVTTAAATSVTNNSAVLNAVVNPKGLSTTAFFEYGKDPGLATPTPTTIQLLGSGSADNVITQSITGLDQGTTYYFRAKAINSAGTKVGTIVTFNTLPLPAATTIPATSKTTNGAILHAVVNPNGGATYAWFEYGLTSALGTVIDNQLRGSGTDNVTIDYTLSSLTPATTYFYRIVANNSVGTSIGTTLTFDTAGGVPTVGTKAATLVTATGGTLNGDVNPSGLATSAWFEWGTTTSFGNILDNTSRGGGTDNVAMSAAIPTQLPGTTIYYRVRAVNSVGPSSPGDTFTFTTLNPAPTANAGPDQNVFQGKTVTLNGSGSSDGFGGTLTYLWAQTAGTTVTLSSTTSATPTFTAPQVAYPSALLTFRLTVTSSRGPTATDNVNVTVKYGFFDDFSTDTTGTYAVTQTLGTGSTFSHDPVAGAALVQTGLNKALSFYRDFGIAGVDTTNVGEFSLIFLPTVQQGAGDGFTIRLGETFPPPGLAYYEISTLDNTVKKVFSGETTETRPFSFAYVPGTLYTIKIIFSPEVTTVQVDGVTLATLNVLQNSIGAFDFTVETKNLDAYYDNIKLQAAP